MSLAVVALEIQLNWKHPAITFDVGELAAWGGDEGDFTVAVQPLENKDYFQTGCWRCGITL